MVQVVNSGKSRSKLKIESTSTSTKHMHLGQAQVQSTKQYNNTTVCIFSRSWKKKTKKKKFSSIVTTQKGIYISIELLYLCNFSKFLFFLSLTRETIKFKQPKKNNV